MITALINIIIWLLIIGVLWWLVDYVIKTIPVPDPPARLIRIAVTIILVLVALNLVLGLLGVSTGLDMPKLG